MWIKLLVILLAALILAYFANQAFQGEMSSGQAIKELFL
jgi:hypothetical protein